jgi:hypothetical protein
MVYTFEKNYFKNRKKFEFYGVPIKKKDYFYMTKKNCKKLDSISIDSCINCFYWKEKMNKYKCEKNVIVTSNMLLEKYFLKEII